jgi:streptomycin 6-kinase
MPHMEGEHEIHGLRFWDGDPTVRLLMADDDFGAMLLERCEPGTVLRALPECEQDVVISGLLRRLWRAPSAQHPFRPLSALTEYWSDETLAHIEQWIDRRKGKTPASCHLRPSVKKADGQVSTLSRTNH